MLWRHQQTTDTAEQILYFLVRIKSQLLVQQLTLVCEADPPRFVHGSVLRLSEFLHYIIIHVFTECLQATRLSYVEAAAQTQCAGWMPPDRTLHPLRVFRIGR